MKPIRPRPAHLARPRTGRRRPVTFAAVAALSLAGTFLSSGMAAGAAATSDTSPVNLSNNINLANGKAAQSATLIEGDARFEVLTPEVVRMEYSPTGSFQDDPTFDILDRNFAVPSYTTSVQSGWLVLTTSDMVLKYQLNSGPFTAVNTQMQLLSALPPGASANVTPTWEWECTFGQICQAGAAALSGGAEISNDHQNYNSPPGFLAGLTATGAAGSWQVLGAPAGAAQATIRYSNGETTAETLDLAVNGTTTTVTLPVTSSWNNWSTVTVPVTLQAGTNTVAAKCDSGNGCNVNIDSVAVAASGTTPAPALPAGTLGGYIRSYDSANGSYSASPACGSGESGNTCAAAIPNMAPGLLDQSGWYLLDDTQTALWTSSGWIQTRPAGDLQDGYLFGYGQNFTQALSDLAKITGPAPLLPESLFGNWFSRYYPYSTSDYQDTVLPAFAANGVTLDNLSVDTDWKSPNTWDGWEWNPSLFPSSTSFLSWAKSEDINVALNVHASIATNDPAYTQAQNIAGGTLGPVYCSAGTTCDGWDWGNVAQAESYFATADPTQNAASFTWLDWCCDNSLVTQPGVTPDSWINYLTAQQMVNLGERGFVLSRIGASNENSQAGAYPAGPWADHRSAVAFTGDTQGTWNTLASEAQLAQDEGAIGEPYVSDDIGSFLGNSGPNDADDLYLRWLELGTFQPIMREHSNSGQNPRLPWNYDAATQAVGDQFMQLREALVPYMYTLAAQASNTGLPMAQALYLDYPAQAAAYTNPTEYLLGSNMLVAPVTTPGDSASTQVWFPPGKWVDYFTGATFTGPGTQTLETPTTRIPVFVKAGGVIPLQPSASHASVAGSAPLTLQVYPGGNGSFSLYNDAGTGLGYQTGQSTNTPVTYTENASAGSSTVTVGPATGSYSGEPANRSYTVDLVDLSKPTSVQINGATLAASGWTYNSATSTVQIPVPATAVGQSVTVTQTGGSAVSLGEPPAVASSSLNTASAGQQVTLTGSGFGASRGSGYLTFSDGGTTWGAPVDQATFTVDSWSNNSVTFTVPSPSGTSGQWAVVPGTTATVSLTSASGQTSNTEDIAVANGSTAITPAVTSVTPASASAGQIVTISGTGFGASQGGNYITFNDNSINWGAPGDAASFTLDSWTNSAITFTVPSPSGSTNQWSVAPGSTATVSVTANGLTSNAGSLAIPSSTAGPTGAVAGYQGMCLDDSAAVTTDNNPIDIFTCNSTNAQSWTVASNGSLQVLGKCMDVAAGGTANGTKVQLYDCNGTGAQVWQAQANGTLVNPQSGRCLDDTNAGGSGTDLEIYDCNGGAEQEWSLP
jgi:Glycosyl hydrolases family 31/Ricin-type beta-trefoil lectin domain/Domain of unknown function (DUF5110)/Carbohydrate binding module (family 6)/IPT/TIG domain